MDVRSWPIAAIQAPLLADTCVQPFGEISNRTVGHCFKRASLSLPRSARTEVVDGRPHSFPLRCACGSVRPVRPPAPCAPGRRAGVFVITQNLRVVYEHVADPGCVTLWRVVGGVVGDRRRCEHYNFSLAGSGQAAAIARFPVGLRQAGRPDSRRIASGSGTGLRSRTPSGHSRAIRRAAIDVQSGRLALPTGPIRPSRTTAPPTNRESGPRHPIGRSPCLACAPCSAGPPRPCSR